MTDFLDQKRSEIAKRLGELGPLIDEYERLQAAAAALEQVTGPKSTSAHGRPSGRPPSAQRGAGRPGPSASASRGAASAHKRPGRRRGSGARTGQTLDLVEAAGTGITIPELAEKMGIKQNYLYRVLPALQKEGKVRKRGRAWLPRAAA